MKPQFHALRRDLDDDTRTSVEMLNVRPNHDTDSTSSCQWTKQDERKRTFGLTWSPFPWRTFFIILTLPLALAPIVTLAAAAETASRNYIQGRDCYPNGSWKETEGATWRIMDSSYFFTPNLSFGAFTFTQVKIIDIAWDLIVGRGGQILLAWVNYRVFNEWLVYHMELHLTSYKMYAAVAFQTTTMGTLGVLGKEFLAFGKGTWKRFFRWLAILSMALSTLYVLSFPTLCSALTGYITPNEPYVENYQRNLIEWSQINRVVYVINDAERIGYAKPLIATLEDSALVNYINIYQSQFDGNNTAWYDTPRVPGVGTFFTNNASTWQFDDSQPPVELTAPSLNITRFEVDGEVGIPPDQVRHRYAYAIDGRQSTLYNATYLLEHGSCKPSETYQWGFSYIFLFMVSIFNFVWSCIMVGMWLDTRRGSRMYKSGRRPGLLRSIMDYSAAIREELGTEVDYLEEEELRQRLRDSGGALVVPKSELRVTRASTVQVWTEQRTWKRNLTKGSTF
ncbi:Nn.00g002550.m01.CDS01 [Neocucurbitaria sp. VM-36]